MTATKRAAVLARAYRAFRCSPAVTVRPTAKLGLDRTYDDHVMFLSDQFYPCPGRIC